ncbi:MAG: hypothetical protein M1826_000139 [Phylliscum demangeonii]|nr:MAG: hypothetical protein M1826_000139 [Phylliscum demangeonii]
MSPHSAPPSSPPPTHLRHATSPAGASTGAADDGDLWPPPSPQSIRRLVTRYLHSGADVAPEWVAALVLELLAYVDGRVEEEERARRERVRHLSPSHPIKVEDADPHGQRPLSPAKVGSRPKVEPCRTSVPKRPAMESTETARKKARTAPDA